MVDWLLHTGTWQRMHGNEGGETGIDDELAAEGLAGFGAWILERNMFAPSEARGRMRPGKGGGATSRRITLPFLC